VNLPHYFPPHPTLEVYRKPKERVLAQEFPLHDSHFPTLVF